MAGSWAGSQEGFALVQPTKLPVQGGDQLGGGGGPPVLHGRVTKLPVPVQIGSACDT